MTISRFQFLFIFIIKLALASIEYRNIGDSLRLTRLQEASGPTGIWWFVRAVDNQMTPIPIGLPQPNDRRVYSWQNISSGCTEITLSISDIQQEDFGDYIWILTQGTPTGCTSAGDRIQLVQMVPASRPVVTCDLTDGITGSCVCNSTGQPPPDFTMTFNGSQTTVSSNEFEFNPVVREHTEGQLITCTVNQSAISYTDSIQHTIDVKYGPYYGGGTLNISSATTQLERLSNGSYRLLTAVNANIPPISCHAACNPSCTYMWHPIGLTYMNSILIGSIGHMGYKQYVCRANNTMTGVSADVQTLHVFVNAPVMPLKAVDVTAFSVELEWSLSYVPPTPLNVSVVVEQLTSGSWTTPAGLKVKTTTPTYSVLILSLQPQTAYTYQVVSLINDEHQSRAEAIINITTGALPTIDDLAMQQNGDEIMFTWVQRGGDVSHVEICVQPESWTSGCNITKTYRLQETVAARLRRQSSRMTHSASVKVPGNLASYRYRIALYDNGILLLTSHWLGAPPHTAKQQTDNTRLWIALGVTVPIILILVLVVLYFLRRKKSPETPSRPVSLCVRESDRKRIDVKYETADDDEYEVAVNHTYQKEREGVTSDQATHRNHYEDMSPSMVSSGKTEEYINTR